MGSIFFLTALFLFICGVFFPSHLLHPLQLPLLLWLALQATILISSRLLTSSGPRRLSYSLLFLCHYKLALLKRFPGQVLTPSGAQPHKHTCYLSNERKAVELWGNLSDLSETAPRSEGRGAETDVPNRHRPSRFLPASSAAEALKSSVCPINQQSRAPFRSQE